MNPFLVRKQYLALSLTDDVARHLSSMSRKDPKTESSKDKAVEARKRLKRLSILLEQIGDLRKLDDGKWKSVLTEIDVRKLIARKVSEMEDFATSRRIELTHDVSHALRPMSTDERSVATPMRLRERSTTASIRPGSPCGLA